MAQLSFIQPSAWSVSDLTQYVRQRLESDYNLQDLWVIGEVSNCSRPSSGHLYFTLKDRGAALRCVMWRNAVQRQSILPRDGDAVEVHGAIGVYEANGVYQLYADLIRPAGEGALYQEFLRLKARLEAEGLFDEARKRATPHMPRRIGIVTSGSGAALRDILNTLQRRYPLVEVILAACPVQGDEAPPGIVSAIEKLNRYASPDAIIVARGGGSIEDLWAFNDERVARAIAASPTPIITGVGHETDFTIADFVADLRAPTPTAAAELATPNRGDLQNELVELMERAELAIHSSLATPRWELNDLKNRLEMRSPLKRLRSHRQQLDENQRRSALLLTHKLQLQRTRLKGLEQRLAALDPHAVLNRGYALVLKPDCSLVRSITETAPGDRLAVHLSDGSLNVQVESREEKDGNCE